MSEPVVRALRAELDGVRFALKNSETARLTAEARVRELHADRSIGVYAVQLNGDDVAIAVENVISESYECGADFGQVARAVLTELERRAR